MKIKWIMAIVVVFGLLTMFYIFQWKLVLKPLLVISCVVLIGAVLLQSGKGGGLAAIGGLADQSAFGTKTSTVLSKATYLIGAAFIFNTILLTKLTLTSIHESGALRQATETMQGAAHIHEGAGHDHDEHAGHDHAPGMHDAAVGGGEAMGMKPVDVTEKKLDKKEKDSKSKAEEKDQP